MDEETSRWKKLPKIYFLCSLLTRFMLTTHKLAALRSNASVVELGTVRRMHEMRDNILSHETPTIVGGKAVYARQNVRKFLRRLSNIAMRIVVWTSMVRSNADLVASYLFIRNLKPYRILAQNQCKMILFPPGRLSRPGQPGIFMKVLSEQLFYESSPLTKKNTLLIDDSREKSVCNEFGNAIFLKP